jgi:hypothetical protein
MKELSSVEVDEVSGAIWSVIWTGTTWVAKYIYATGMGSYNNGYGDAYLEALNGGNLGA